MVHLLVASIEQTVTRIVCALAIRRGVRNAVDETRTPGGFLVGTALSKDHSEPRGVYLHDRELQRHCYLIGGSGSGKTNLLLQLILAHIVKGQTVVVIDLQGDLHDRLVSRLVARGEIDPLRFCCIDLRQTARVVGYNPLAGPGEPHVRALQALDVMKRRSEGWGVQIDETLRNSLIALAEVGMTLVEVEPLLTDAIFRERTLRRVRDAAVLSFFARYDSLSEERRSTWALPCLNKITPFVSVPRLRRMLGASAGIDLKEILDTPGKIVSIALAAHELHSAANIVGGLLLTGITDAVMARASIPESKRNRTLLVADEFQKIASDGFLPILAESRRFALSCILAHQNLAQIQPNIRQAIRVNVATQFLFQSSAVDASDLAKDLAPYAKRDVAQSMITTQKVGEAVLVRRGQPPVRLRTLHSPDPEVSGADVSGFIEHVMANCSRDAAEVDAEIAARLSASRSPRRAAATSIKPPIAARRKQP